MHLDPVLPGGLALLERYYEAARGSGGPACWVHPHANGRDFVVTPPDWGQNPNAEHQGWIDLSMEAITKSRSTLESIGTLDVHLYALLTDLSAAELGRSGNAEAFWLLDNDCWMEMRPASRSDPRHRAPPAEAYRFIVAHEIGHCFLMENIHNYVPQTSWIATVKWWDESGAEFLASQVYPTIDYEHYWASRFDLDATRWFQPYASYIVLQQYANTHSPQAVIEFLEWLHEVGKVADSGDREGLRRFFEAIYNHPTLGEFYHEFVVTHYRSRVKDPGGDTAPREQVVDNYFEFGLVPDSGGAPIPLPPANMLNLVQLTVPAGYDLRLGPPTGSDKRHYQTLWENGRFIQDWAGEVSIGGSCNYDTEVRVFFTHHYEPNIEGVEMEYWLDEKCPCDDEEITDCCMKPRTSDLEPGNDLRPYYDGTEPVKALAACMLECQDRCWCRNKHMWSFEAVTKAECDQYYPNGTVSFAPGMPTKCQGMTHPSRRQPPPAKKDVLDLHCGVQCSQQCPDSADRVKTP